MSLPDLLQWLGAARKTGTLTVECRKVSKSIFMGSGRVTGCTSDAPAERLGHFLFARGKITENQLRQALVRQESNGQFLGRLLVEMQAISEADLSACLGAQAEETIYSLFEWDQAVFRFTDDVVPRSDFPVDLRVEDILLRGLQRFDEIQHIREVFNDPGIVLAHTKVRPPDALLANPTARKLYESVNGERTVAGILLDVHGSEYMVTKFLYELHSSGFVAISHVRETEVTPAPAAVTPTPVAVTAAEGSPTVDPAPASQAVPPPPVAEWEPVPGVDAAVDMPEVPQFDSIFESALPPEPVEASKADSIRTRLAVVREFMGESDYEQALEVLDQLYAEHPGDESLRRLTAEAEAAFIERTYRHFLPPAKIPRLTRQADDVSGISPTEFFLLSRIDGTWDIKSIIQVAPLRETDALRTLKRMREQGVIELHDPE